MAAQLFAEFLDIPGGGCHARYDKWIERYRQPVLIYNPYAGKIRRSRQRILQATTAALARAEGFLAGAPRILPTDAAGHATALAREAVALGADLVLVLGGDGTVNEAVNGMVNSGVALGVIPAGTANVLAMELGLGSRLDRAVERLSRCVPRRIALGRLAVKAETRYFVSMAGAGLDATIVTEVNAALKERAGKAAYWAAGLAQFRRRLEQIEVRVHGRVYQCGFALASRVRNYGGDLEIARGAALTRQDFEVVLFEGRHPLRYACYMLGVGLRAVQKMPGVRTLAAPCLEILSSAHLQIDGEYAGRRPARLEIVPHALTLLMPASTSGSTGQ